MPPPASPPGRPTPVYASRPTLAAGGFTFAEQPEAEAPDARIIWRADIDPGTLSALAVPIDAGHPDAVDAAALAPWLTIARDASGEHAVLSDGWRHIRIDIARGSLAAGDPVMLHYDLYGVASANAKILPLRRFLNLCRHRRFAVELYPRDRRVERWILALRVHDALAAGASHRDIAHVLFDADLETLTSRGSSDFVRSRVRRLVTEARRLAGGGYRALMNRRG